MKHVKYFGRHIKTTLVAMFNLFIILCKRFGNHIHVDFNPKGQ